MRLSHVTLFVNNYDIYWRITKNLHYYQRDIDKNIRVTWEVIYNTEPNTSVHYSQLHIVSLEFVLQYELMLIELLSDIVYEHYKVYANYEFLYHKI